jgi:DNA (cytosine-5)-methyltransferase 1
MRYLSVCSGIEAATVAWHPLGWTSAAFSEIEAFPRAVLSHRWPDVPLHGDFTTIKGDEYGPIDLLVGGTPCQSFSVAGLRGGLADDRGNLALEFLRLAHRARPKWLVWENVLGVLSTNGGRDFGSILGGLVELGYGFAYRVLNAQFFGIPQRRRRVFVVGYLGDWRRAAAVLFERHSLQGHPAPRRQAGEGVAPTIASRPSGGGGLGTDFDCDGGLIARAFGGNNTNGPIDVATACNGHAGPHGRLDFESETFIAHALCADGFDAPEAIALHTRQDPCTGDIAFAHDAVSPSPNAVLSGAAVRRLTPEECEALQGFPRQYTLIPYRGKPAADGPRYKALGNSMAVPVMRWIGQRIQMVEELAKLEAAA